MMTKNIIITVIVIVVGIVSYKIGFNNGAGQSVVDVIDTTTEASDAIAPIVFDGTGRSMVGPIPLGAGLTLMHAKNQSGSNSTFGATVYSDDNSDGVIDPGEGWTGTTINVGYEEAEAYNGTLAFKASGAPYFVDTEGGRWQLSFEQPAKLTSPAPDPDTFSGKNSNVTDKFYLKTGDYSFHVTNDGGGNFIIYLLDEDGNSTGRLVNQVGEYEGDFAVNAVFDGNYVFAVEGGNNWTITKN